MSASLLELQGKNTVLVLVVMFSPCVALKTNITLFFVTSFEFRPFQTDNNNLEKTPSIINGVFGLSGLRALSRN